MKPLNLYIAKKYIWAKSIKDALKKDKAHGIDDIWMDDTYRNKLNSGVNENKIGFSSKAKKK